MVSLSDWLPPAALSEVTIVHDKKPQPGLNYGRIKRAPRLPLKKGKSSDSSSSASEGGEDSSCGEDEAGEQEELGAEESGEEDKKEVCIQVKVAKEEKSKPSIDRTGVSDVNSSWDPIRATRQNQDIQREIEDTCMLDIQGHLVGRRKGKLVKNINVDVQTYGAGGSFLRLEQDWRESHLAYLQHKSCLNVRAARPASAGR